MEKLGAVSLSPDILQKSNIGLWALEYDEGKQNAFIAGMNGHVAKPLDVPKLLTTLAEILQ